MAATHKPFAGVSLVITSGNSTGSVSTALARRHFDRLKEKVALQQQSWEAHFTWKPTWDGLRPPPAALQWARAHALPGKRALVNHWRALEPLTTKDSFFQVMREYYAARGLDYTLRLPETHVIAPLQGKPAEAWAGWPELAAAVRRHAAEGALLWLAKPTSENRGLGIEVLFSEREIQGFLEKKGRAAALGVKTHWCVQKYLERPLLSPDGRKFDLRVWALVLDTGEVCVHAPGYVRTSSDAFSLADTSRYSHLTNYCQQKHSKSFGAHEVGNTVRWETLEAWLEQVPLPAGAGCGAEALWGCGEAGVWGQVLRGVCEAMDALRLRGSQRVGGMGLAENGFARRPPAHIVPSPPPPPQSQPAATAAAAAPLDPQCHRLPPQPPGPLGSRHQYELLGLDFMLTTDLRAHFIEVNTNPSLDHQSQWHGQLVDTMLDRLVDVVLAAAYPEGGAVGPDPAGSEVNWLGAPGGPASAGDAAAAGAAAGGGGGAAESPAQQQQQPPPPAPQDHAKANTFRPQHGWHYVYNVYTSPSLVPVGYVSPNAAGGGGGVGRGRAASKQSAGSSSSGEEGAAARGGGGGGGAAAAAAAAGGGGAAASPQRALRAAPAAAAAPPPTSGSAATRITPPGSPSRRNWRGAYGPKEPTAAPAATAADGGTAHLGHALLQQRSKSVSRHSAQSHAASAVASAAAASAAAGGGGAAAAPSAPPHFTPAALSSLAVAPRPVAPPRASSTPKPFTRASSATHPSHAAPQPTGSRLALDALAPLSLRGVSVGVRPAAAAAAAAPGHI
jgi:hypothetical protein